MSSLFGNYNSSTFDSSTSGGSGSFGATSSTGGSLSVAGNQSTSSSLFTGGNNTNTSNTNNPSFSFSQQQYQTLQQQSQSQQQDKQYVPSRIFSQDRTDLLASTDKRKTSPESNSLITTSPQHHTHHHYGHHQQLSPSTPYSYSLKSRFGESGSGSMMSSPIASGMMRSLPTHQSQSSMMTMMIDKDYIPRTSIYDDPSPSTSSLNNTTNAASMTSAATQISPQSFFETPISPVANQMMQHQQHQQTQQLQLQVHQFQVQQQQQMQQQPSQQTMSSGPSSSGFMSQTQPMSNTLPQPQQPTLSLSSLANSTPMNMNSNNNQLMTMSALQATNHLPANSIMPSTSLYYTASAENLPLYSDKYDRRWVTIFGFPQTASDVVLDEIESNAHIVEVKYPPSSNANWLHIKLESEAIAQDLLARNGMIIGNCMIGITPYKEAIKNETESQQLNTQLPFKEIEAYTPYRRNYDPSEYNNTSQSNPTKPSLMSKISEYVFGI